MTHQLDITRDCCPMTFIKVKLALERLAAGETLEVLLNQGEPLNNVPRTVVDQGHEVLDIRPEGAAHCVVIRKRGADAPRPE
jgi:tRNA 2-thiouridine synthesizing protein A